MLSPNIVFKREGGRKGVREFNRGAEVAQNALFQ
jgi:hypothetical protein